MGLKQHIRLCWKQTFGAGFSPSGFLYACWLRLRGRELLVRGVCVGCGVCCRRISLFGAEGWLRQPEDFARMVSENPDYARFRIIGHDKHGYLLFDCEWCTPEGRCRDYEKRLPLCKKFPEKSMMFCGGQLPPECSYSFAEVVPFARFLEREVQRKKYE